MAFTKQNVGVAFAQSQSTLDQADLDALVAALNKTGWISGAAVTQQGSPNMTVAVAAGVGMASGTLFTISAGNVTITAADATNPRKDLVVATSGGLAARTGTPAAVTSTSGPVEPALQAGDVLLAAVYVPAGATSIVTSYITDGRVPAYQLEVVRMGKTGTLQTGVGTTPVVFERNRSVIGAFIYCNTAPTGASVIVDINKNGTTIFTTQGNRPTIAVSTKASAIKVPDSAQQAFVGIGPGAATPDILTADIDQVGSTIAGADLGIGLITV